MYSFFLLSLSFLILVFLSLWVLWCCWGCRKQPFAASILCCCILGHQKTSQGAEKILPFKQASFHLWRRNNERCRGRTQGNKEERWRDRQGRRKMKHSVCRDRQWKWKGVCFCVCLRVGGKGASVCKCMPLCKHPSIKTGGVNANTDSSVLYGAALCQIASHHKWRSCIFRAKDMKIRTPEKQNQRILTDWMQYRS